MITQKTVRFYSESVEDLKALQALNNYRDYGFNNSREMIIAAINAFSGGGRSPSGVNILNIEEVAEAIAERIKLNAEIKINKEEIKLKEEKYDDNNDNESNYKKAMDFINNL